MVDILNNHTSNQEFLDFAVNQIHNVDVATTHHGEPSAQVCDLLLNKNGKLYIATSSQNPFFRDLINQPKVIVNGYKGNGTMDSCGFSIKGIIKNVDHQYIDEIFEKNAYLNEIYADNIEVAKEDLRVLEITPQSAGYLDHRTTPIFIRKFKF
ncbi:MAG: hypothetical protein K2O75_05255 [Lactobacillus sp.]|uniref:hypothetical protein n=1 Tax=Lactobacillus sp. TaxID=1591 RepID=UPI0023C19195|nr:hypothetical protein [Lactobacillus sp.]MDE7050262.1 hypothetical protein [Lactobacillus sp.]